MHDINCIEVYRGPIDNDENVVARIALYFYPAPRIKLTRELQYAQQAKHCLMAPAQVAAKLANIIAKG